MPALRRHRRDHRARAPKPRRSRNLEKFIPEADSDFAYTAHCFVHYLQRSPASYQVTDDEVSEIDRAVKEFRAALTKHLLKGSCTKSLIAAKNVARAKAEEVVRRFANIIRADPRVTPTHKKLVRINERPKKVKARRCPTHPPKLTFAGSGDGTSETAGIGSGCGVHVLKFHAFDNSRLLSDGAIRKAKPKGATRLELFVDLVPPGEPVPSSPADRMRQGRGWPLYLRSFSRSPIEVEFPIPSQPMLVVYWARWADESGAVGRFSKTCVARVEGWSATPALSEATEARRVETKYVLVQALYDLPGGCESDAESDAAGNGRLLLAGAREGDASRRLLNAA